MTKRRWQAHIGLIFLSLVLVAVLNPELRAALLIVDSIGLDLVVLLVATQLRVWAPFLYPWAAELGRLAGIAGVYAFRSILPTLLYIMSPRLMPAPLVLLMFLCAASELQVTRRAATRPIRS